MDSDDLKRILALKQEIGEVENNQVVARNKVIALLIDLGFVFIKPPDSPTMRLRLLFPVTGAPHNWHSFLEINASGCYFKNSNTVLGDFRVEIFNTFQIPDFNHGYDAYGDNRVEPGTIATDKDLVVAIETTLKSQLDRAKQEEERSLSFANALSIIEQSAGS